MQRLTVGLVAWIIASGGVSAEAREDLSSMSQRFETLLGECFDNVDFDKDDAKQQADLCEFRVPSLSAVPSQSGDGTNIQVMAVGISLRGPTTGKRTLSISCQDDKITVLGLTAAVSDTSTIDTAVSYRFGDGETIAGDWEVVDRTVYLADENAISLAKQIKERQDEELIVTTAINNLSTETRFNLTLLSEPVDVLAQTCGWS